MSPELRGLLPSVHGNPLHHDAAGRTPHPCRPVGESHRDAPERHVAPDPFRQPVSDPRPAPAPRAGQLPASPQLQGYTKFLPLLSHTHDPVVLESQRLPDDTFHEHGRPSTYEASKNSISSWFRSCSSTLSPQIHAQILKGAQKNKVTSRLSCLVIVAADRDGGRIGYQPPSPLDHLVT